MTGGDRLRLCFSVFEDGRTPRVGFRVRRRRPRSRRGRVWALCSRPPQPEPVPGSWPTGLGGHARPDRPARLWRRGAHPARRGGDCTFLSRSGTTSTSTRRSSTRRTSVASSGPDAEPLLPNWRHLPVGYHGRGRHGGRQRDAGRAAVRSGEGTRTIRAPRSARAGGSTSSSSWASSSGSGAVSGSRCPRSAFRDHVFGVVLVNDWSARDIQAWEYQPLGPFLGKSFATSISAWVTPLALLEDRFVPVAEAGSRAASVPARRRRLGSRRRARGRALGHGRLSHERSSGLYWTMPQQLAHATVERRVDRDGRPLRLGDDLGAGARERGLADRAHVERRARPIRLGDGRTRRSSRTATRWCSADARASSSSARCAERSFPREASQTRGV